MRHGVAKVVAVFDPSPMQDFVLFEIRAAPE